MQFEQDPSQKLVSVSFVVCRANRFLLREGIPFVSDNYLEFRLNVIHRPSVRKTNWLRYFGLYTLDSTYNEIFIHRNVSLQATSHNSLHTNCINIARPTDSRGFEPRAEPSPMLMNTSAVSWIEKAQPLCCPLYSQQVNLRITEV